MAMDPQTLLAALGTLVIAAYVFSFVRLLASLFILQGTSVSHFGARGSWALVTGASDGLGKEYATQLAARGFNIVLVSRTASKLQTIATELAEKYGIQTKQHAMDFSLNKDSDYSSLKQKIDGLNIAILINNVGQSHSIPVPFLETPTQEMNDIITINCFGTLKITQLVAPAMVKNRRGLILTMASFGGILPTPFLATYSGSKAFLQQWSSALASELEPSGVKVQLVQSYLVTSAMSKIRRASATIPAPKAFVRAALSKVGRSGGAQGMLATSTPYWSHGMMHWALATFTGTMNGTVIGVNRKMHEGIRKRALRKAERDSKKA